MAQLEGLKNFAVNIKPTMLKIKNGGKLTANEKECILQFYLEVIDYISKVK